MQTQGSLNDEKSRVIMGPSLKNKIKKTCIESPSVFPPGFGEMEREITFAF